MLSLVDEVHKQGAALVSMQRQLHQLARCIAKQTGCTQLVDSMPHVVDPSAGFEVPGPFDENQREMHPREQHDLSVRMQHVGHLRNKKEGIRRILDPDNLSQNRRLLVDFHNMSTQTKWKLWHFCMYEDTCLKAVLTKEERAASSRSRAASAPTGSDYSAVTEETTHAAMTGMLLSRAEARVHQAAVDRVQHDKKRKRGGHEPAPASAALRVPAARHLQ